MNWREDEMTVYQEKWLRCHGFSREQISHWNRGRASDTIEAAKGMPEQDRYAVDQLFDAYARFSSLLERMLGKPMTNRFDSLWTEVLEVMDHRSKSPSSTPRRS